METQLHDREQSIRHLEEATLLDPKNSSAWAQLGLTTGSMSWLQDPEDFANTMEQAYVFVQRAVELDPESAHSTSMLGMIFYTRKELHQKGVVTQ